MNTTIRSNYSNTIQIPNYLSHPGRMRGGWFVINACWKKPSRNLLMAKIAEIAKGKFARVHFEAFPQQYFPNKQTQILEGTYLRFFYRIKVPVVVVNQL